MNCKRILSFLLVLSLSASIGCSNAKQQPKIFLSNLQPIPVAASSYQRPIVIAVAGVFSPETTLDRYQKLVDYLSEKTGKPFELAMRTTYEEVNDMIRTGVASLAFVSSGAYVEGQREFGMQLLAAPEIGDKTSDYSYIIVPAGSPSQSLADLKDTTFACTFPLSDTGSLALSYSLQQQGYTLETFFHRYTYTDSNDKSIKAIAEFLYDGAAVNSISYEEMTRTEPDTVGRTRVVAKLGPYAVSPIVVPPFLDGALKSEIKDALLSADRDELGMEALRALDVDRFVTVADSDYDSIREMAKKVWWTR